MGTTSERGRGKAVGALRAGMRAWMACMERREEEAHRRLIDHVLRCVPCTRAMRRGDLLDAAQLCAAGSGLLAAWDDAEDAIAAAVLPAAVA